MERENWRENITTVSTCGPKSEGNTNGVKVKRGEARALKTNNTCFTVLSPTGNHYSVCGGQVTRRNDIL